MSGSRMPAPPPPPPPPIVCVKQVKDEEFKTSINKSVAKHLKNTQEKHQLGQNDLDHVRELFRTFQERQKSQNSNYFVAFRKWKLSSVIQEGPQCGIVALSMASQVLTPELIPPETIYHEAVARGYTKQGEMFSAQNLSDLGAGLLHCDSHVLKGDRNDMQKSIIANLLAGHLVVIPYDSEHNHTPCFKSGRKAHWAVLSGILIGTSQIPEDVEAIASQDTEYKQLYHVDTSRDVAGLKSLQNLICAQDVDNDINVFVFANHGKSLHLQLWDLDALVGSNGQLTEIDKDIFDDRDNYCLPKDGIHCSLNSTAVCLTR